MLNIAFGRVGHLLYGMGVLMVLAQSCAPDSVEPEEPVENQTLFVNPSYLTFEREGGNKSLTVITTQPWELTIIDDWLIASSMSGTHQQSITFTASSNESLGERSSEVQFRSGNSTQTLEVTQKGSVFEALEKNVKEFMDFHQIPAASIAVTYKERLVYLKTMGLQDLDENIPATNKNLYRIASISKVVTLAAILKLVEEGKLDVFEKVLGDQGILGYDFGDSFADPRLTDIDVDQLLKHEAGWHAASWLGAPIDGNADIPVYINQVLSNVPLAYTPGTSSSYVSFDYLLLGKIIEKITGERYEDYVKSKILAPMGITDMHIGGNTPADRKENEVYYFQDGKRVEYVNVWQSEACGGWIASAESLARFLVHVDRINHRYPDILPQELVAPYLLGWGSWTHDGGCPGTAARASRLNDDINYVLLFNAGVPFDRLTTHEVLIKQAEWPDWNLFEE